VETSWRLRSLIVGIFLFDDDGFDVLEFLFGIGPQNERFFK
jgi:hypothetical protein